MCLLAVLRFYDFKHHLYSISPFFSFSHHRSVLLNFWDCLTVGCSVSLMLLYFSIFPPEAFLWSYLLQALCFCLYTDFFPLSDVQHSNEPVESALRSTTWFSFPALPFSPSLEFSSVSYSVLPHCLWRPNGKQSLHSVLLCQLHLCDVGLSLTLTLFLWVVFLLPCQLMVLGLVSVWVAGGCSHSLL